ncbi:hypothetical protein Moror_4637 [Moniliophthora roreri MCA 2997]|uniref:BTB domain-containing protein n=2 Tax=Moniliophthora roreri TaxID=221103 RepID=V2XF48_MONRO|nr:hypothetical protein Moror_4637 [Moniliophthora roreri MCA 2997]KAI3613679.1 hypothetical protein WG66_013581 [Moniliophthora roreri]
MAVCEVIENCQLAIDIFLQSADGKLLATHSRNLESFNEAFPLSGSVTQAKGDVVSLSENADALLLLLKFSHNNIIPDISYLGLDALISFAEVADKYGNHIALHVCRGLIENRVNNMSPEESLRFLRYKIARDDLEDIDSAVRRSMTLPLHQALNQLRDYPSALHIYALYADRWKESMVTYRSLIDSKSGSWLEPQKLARYEDRPTRIHKMAAQILFMKLEENPVLSLSALDDTIGLAEQISPGFRVRCSPTGWVQSFRDVVGGYPTWREMKELRDQGLS